MEAGADKTLLAVVPYDEDKILPHEKRVRNFHIAGKSFEIAQDWQKFGVAAVVWDSAVVLGEYLHQHPHLVQEKKVLELGAGTGLAGLVAASLGGDVTVSERAEAIDHLRTTVRSNCRGTSWSVTPIVLDWVQPLDTSLYGRFDIILGADIIYIEDTFQDLLRTLTDLTVGSESTVILLSCRLRYQRDLKFLSMLESDFVLKEVHFDNERDVKVYQANRKS